MFRTIIVGFAIGMILAGCGRRLDSKTHMYATLPESMGQPPRQMPEMSPGLEQLAHQVFGRPMTARAAGKYALETAPLPPEVASTAVVRSLVDTMLAPYERREPMPVTLVEADIEAFGDALRVGADAILNMEHDSLRAITVMHVDGLVTWTGMFWAYYQAYSAGEFHERTGRLLAKPSGTSAGIGNDTIVGFARVFLASVVDYAMATPVLHNNETYYTTTGKKPTCAVLDGSLIKSIEEAGVSDAQAKLIREYSNLAGDRSELIAGLVYRLLGDIEVGFVVAGNFSVGDHETLAKLVDNLFEVASRRTIEHLLYERIADGGLAALGEEEERLLAAQRQISSRLSRERDHSAGRNSSQ